MTAVGPSSWLISREKSSIFAPKIGPYVIERVDVYSKWVWGIQDPRHLEPSHDTEYSLCHSSFILTYARIEKSIQKKPV